ncbi:MAG: sulfatase-like hydrolase/transferase [Candidatus Fibromonas sp.]|jgi:phosphoglycerol transferase MdoB-like AlkP superfamily enzyme|nr:sulfatase-like hydrolase/transferase [Candidatus Fibromonas sp.]
MSFFAKVPAIAKALLPFALASWAVHAVLRVLLLFRNDPFGIPFVNKPDWYVFHAIAWDYMWIAASFAIWVIFVRSKIAFVIFHVIILLLTYLDQETQRFLGSHVSLALMDTYKDPSSVVMFWDYFAYDQSVPFLQVAVLLLMFPALYFLNRLLSRYFGKKTSFRIFFTGGAIFYLCCWLFLNVIWTGGFRLKKLTPVVNLIYSEAANFSKYQVKHLSEEEILEYHEFWKEIEGEEGNSGAVFSRKYPLWNQTGGGGLNLEIKPNFIVVFLESHRYADVKESSPFLCSLMNAGLSFNRMHASGLPTVGGLLSSLTGIPTHSTKTQVTDLPFISLPSFASYLRDAGWRADFFSAADPAWDNLGVWMAKWYDRQHYSREREDDSLFWDWAGEFIRDSLANRGKPFLATFITRSNHYPFNFAANMPQAEKDKTIRERIVYTMNYADRQFARFARSIQNEPWFENTYLIVLADHGFPLGENGNATMSGGAYYSSTHIPFVIAGKDIPQKTDTVSTSQIDIAPTILDLAGIKEPNPFMGHSLLKKRGNFALGTHYSYKTLNHGNFRLICREGEESLLFENSDSLQTKDVSGKNREEVLKMEKLVNLLVKVSDFALENDRIVPK